MAVDTFTSKLGLRKPDRLNQYLVSQFNSNADLIDAAIGSVICTSTTRPATPWAGLTIYETDTRRLAVWNGSWVVLPGHSIIANLAARTAITTLYDGMMIWRQDMDWVEIYDGTAWRALGVVVTAALSDITNPYTNQLVFLSTVNLYYRWSGSVWVVFAAAGGTTTATRHRAKYTQTGTAQNIPTSVQQRVAFNTTIFDSNDWTVGSSGGGSVFTCAREGHWGITYNTRYVGGVAAERAFTLAANGAPMGTAYGCHSAYTGGTAPYSGGVRIDQDFSVGDTICAFAYQAAAANLALDIAVSPTSITFDYMGMKNT